MRDEFQDARSMELHQPPGSKVTTDELLREVDEYFAIGVKVAPGDTVLDVGANVGAFSYRVAQKCDGDVTLVCFEPSPDTYRALCSNFERKPVLRKTRYTVHPVGLTSRERVRDKVSFYNFRRFPTNNTLDLAEKRREFELFFEDRGRRTRQRFERVAPRVGRAMESVIAGFLKNPAAWWLSMRIMGLEETQVRLETLTDAIVRDKIDRVNLLKIDVEGLELDVLRGIEPAVWPRVHQVVMETHNRDGRQDMIEALLRTNGLSEIRTTQQKSVDNGLESVLLLATRPG